MVFFFHVQIALLAVVESGEFDEIVDHGELSGVEGFVEQFHVALLFKDFGVVFTGVLQGFCLMVELLQAGAKIQPVVFERGCGEFCLGFGFFDGVFVFEKGDGYSHDETVGRDVTR